MYAKYGTKVPEGFAKDMAAQAAEANARSSDPLYRGATDLLSDNTDSSNAYEYGGEAGRALKDLGYRQRAGVQGLKRQGPQLDLNRDYALRGQQVGLAGAYANQMNGGGPSTANIQLARGLDSAAAQAGMARAASPMNLAAAQRGGIVGSGAAGQAAAVAGANQRATEISNARMGLAGVGSQMSGRDMGNADAQARLDLQQRALNDQYFNRNEDLAQEIMRLQTQGQQARSEGIASYQKMMREKQMGASKAAYDEENNERNTVLGVGQGLLSAAALFSDERIKENVSDGSKQVREALDALSPKHYSYKKESGQDTSPRAGIMAQDLERSAAGRATVRELNGVKVVDVPQATGLALAALADVHSRLKKIESKK